MFRQNLQNVEFCLMQNFYVNNFATRVIFFRKKRTKNRKKIRRQKSNL